MSLALMDEMRSWGLEPGEGCHVMALKACAAAGLWEKALEMLGEMRAARVNRSENSFVVAMKACGDAGRWREAVALMDDMRRDGVPPMETAYTTAVRSLRRETSVNSCLCRLVSRVVVRREQVEQSKDRGGEWLSPGSATLIIV